MTYQVLDNDGTPLDAHFDVEGSTLIFHSRGGSKGKNATNVDYARGLRLLVQRLSSSGHPVARAWVDSSRVQNIPIDDRLILNGADMDLAPEVQVSRMASRMQGIGRDPASRSDHGNSTKRIRLQLLVSPARPELLTLLRCVPAKKDFRSQRRLPASELRKVTAEHLFNAVQELLAGTDRHEFQESTDYDVVLEDGSRLPPKAVFGLAASAALGFEVKPEHFVGGLESPCFEILEGAKYRIVPKGEVIDTPDIVDEDLEWSEGSPRLRYHLRRERKASVREAKKAEFRRNHGGHLFCERCGANPVQTYQTDDAEACIEVHHARVQVSEMADGHATRLQDLQCLCANCHRLTHREMRKAAAEKAQ